VIMWSRTWWTAAPIDRFQEADISGGAPYGLAVPNAAADGLLNGEHHQTTLVDYLRITLAHAGMGCIDHPDISSALPDDLRESALRLQPI
jgi:hypothetical protein